MSDDDMIRRGDALALCDQYPYVEGVKTALHAHPAVQPSTDVVALVDALRRIADGYGPNHLSKFCRDIAAAALARLKGGAA